MWVDCCVPYHLCSADHAACLSIQMTPLQFGYVPAPEQVEHIVCMEGFVAVAPGKSGPTCPNQAGVFRADWIESFQWTTQSQHGVQRAPRSKYSFALASECPICPALSQTTSCHNFDRTIYPVAWSNSAGARGSPILDHGYLGILGSQAIIHVSLLLIAFSYCY